MQTNTADAHHEPIPLPTPSSTRLSQLADSIMSKKRFVQHIIIRSLPELNKLAQAINYAESLWDGLSQHGYAADKSEAHDGKDHYQALTPTQKKAFIGFWNAFNYKQNRNGAAMRWAQLGELTADDYKIIIEAAKKEAQKQLPPGQARKMAQGWLHEKRYHDYQATQKSKGAEKNHILNRLNIELNGIKTLYQASKDGALLQQIEKLEQAIKDARAKQ